MAPKDKIIKATWNIFQSTKDTVSKNVLTAIREEKVKIDTVYVEKPCIRNHYDCPSVEPIREKERKKRVDTIVKIDTSVTKI